jgi:2'-5' RNA ligase
MKCAGFEMAFDRVACWRHNHIAHLGIARPPEALFALVEQLSSNLEAAGISFDVRPYKPHITLIRKAECARFPASGDASARESSNQSAGDNPNENPALEPIRWSARDFVLVRSSLRPGGARYEQLGRWPLL